MNDVDILFIFEESSLKKPQIEQFKIQESEIISYKTQSQDHQSISKQMQSEGPSLNQTFIPKTILRKSQFKITNPVIEKNNFEKTHGNVYVQLDPPEIKFNGYQINKINTLSFKIINKAPVPQRFNILPPTDPHFAIKVNKKGNIPTGMYQTVQVTFKATQFKYMYDVVKINTQTQNFVLPLYAYPTIPNINTIFPKLIDFGNIQLKQTESFLYPIKNPTPIDFKFDFMYKKQCPEIMINPLTGIIPGNGEIVIEIAFIPAKKMTYSAQAYFKIQQFDFEAIVIQIIGSGKDKEIAKTFKRLKSSKLVPIKQKDDELQKQKQKEQMNSTQTYLNQKIKDPKKSFVSSIRKINPKTTFPKLLSSTMKQRTLKPQEQQILGNQKTLNGSAMYPNDQERKFLSRFNRVQQLDREKEIKFAQFLGDKAMTQSELQAQRNTVEDMHKFRQNLIKTQCQSRYNPEKMNFAEIEYKNIKAQQITWDQNKNDFIYERRMILNKFVIGVSKVIESRRIKKRFEKIRDFLRNCSSKQEVAKKVEQSYQKSLDLHSLNGFKGEIEFQFNRYSIEPIYLEVQFTESKEKFSSRVFEPEGKTQFDDLTTLQLIEEHEAQKMNYSLITFPADFVNLNKQIPQTRVSGQEQFSIKSSSLPHVDPIELLNVVGKPFEIPNHYFIYENGQAPLFMHYEQIDQKDTRYLFSNDEPVQDQFEGWSKGDHQVLKAKLLKNSTINYSIPSALNYSSHTNDIGFLGDISKNLPKFIDKPIKEDQLSDDDSDDEKYEEAKTLKVQQFLQKIEVNPELKVRRTKNKIEDEQKKMSIKIQKNLQKDKLQYLTKYIQKAKNFNKMAQKPQNFIII